MTKQPCHNYRIQVCELLLQSVANLSKGYSLLQTEPRVSLEKCFLKCQVNIFVSFLKAIKYVYEGRLVFQAIIVIV